MSNSFLASYIKISPFRTSPRNHKIDTITIHCIVGQWTAQQGCNFFATAGYAPNYVVGKDGSIGMCVPEADRSWCSGGRDRYGNPIRVNGISGADNDQRAITIEVASDTFAPYRVTDAAYQALIKLCIDICKRNNIKELKWQANKNLVGKIDQQNMTVHRWFANKSCPGDYLYSHHFDIMNQVNQELKHNIPSLPPNNNDDNIKIGDKFYLKEHAKYISGQNIPQWVINREVFVREIRVDQIIFSTMKQGAITGIINKDQIKYFTNKPFLIKTTVSNLNIRKEPSNTAVIVGQINQPGLYTIVKVVNNWGKLKSGIGWINLKYTNI